MLQEEGCQDLSPTEDRDRLAGTDPRYAGIWDLLWELLVFAQSPHVSDFVSVVLQHTGLLDLRPYVSTRGWKSR